MSEPTTTPTPATVPGGAPDPLLPDADWRPVSPRYAPVRRASALVGSLIVWGVAIAASWLTLTNPFLTGGLAAAGIAWTSWRVVRAGRWVASWRWAERDGDLCIAHGLWNRQLTIVPFGRLQVVDVTAGPLLRWQRLADVQLVTASAHTNARIPGLDRADAAALRDRMIELSDAKGSGL